MSTNDAIELELEVRAEDSNQEDIDKITRNLLSELRSADVESATLVSTGIAPEGSKGDPITIGAIVIQVLPTALPAIISLVQGWVMRGQNRTVKFKGNGIEFEGAPEDLEKLLEQLNKGKKKK